MKTSATKLKKLRTKTIYGFRRHMSGSDNNFLDPTTNTITTATTTVTATGGTMIF